MKVKCHRCHDGKIETRLLSMVYRVKKEKYEVFFKLMCVKCKKMVTIMYEEF